MYGCCVPCQFAEDAGPMAHPMPPGPATSEINNFYTVTVYEKGAEVIRMLQTLLGREGFRKGMDLYFERHDGQAVTCDDFVAGHGRRQPRQRPGAPARAVQALVLARPARRVVQAEWRFQPRRTAERRFGTPRRSAFHSPCPLATPGPERETALRDPDRTWRA